MWSRDPQKEAWVGTLYEHDIISLETSQTCKRKEEIEVTTAGVVYWYVDVVVTFATLTGGTETILTERLDKTTLNTLRRTLTAHSLK